MKILKDLDVMTLQIDALKKKAGIKDKDLKNALESKMVCNEIINRVMNKAIVV